MSDELLGTPGKLNTLLSRISGERADEIDAMYGMLATIAVALTSARIEKLDFLNAYVSTVGGANPTAQRGAWNMTSTQTNVNVTIAAIPNVNKAFLLPVQCRAFTFDNYDGGFISAPVGYIVNATTINISRGASNDRAMSGRWELVYWS